MTSSSLTIVGRRLLFHPSREHDVADGLGGLSMRREEYSFHYDTEWEE
jgi:hypothetical protein